jgi:hypothetical protein
MSEGGSHFDRVELLAGRARPSEMGVGRGMIDLVRTIILIVCCLVLYMVDIVSS